MSNMSGDPTDARIPPTGGSGTAPPHGCGRPTIGQPPDPGPMRLTLDAAALDHLIAHQRAEIDRLALQVRAEQEHNRRLMAAVGFYRAAADRGAAIAHMGTVTDMDSDVAKEAVAAIRAALTRGDDLAVPLASAP